MAIIYVNPNEELQEYDLEEDSIATAMAATVHNHFPYDRMDIMAKRAAAHDCVIVVRPRIEPEPEPSDESNPFDD